MFMGKPWHQHWRQEISSIDDIPDINKDGKHTLMMIATSDQHLKFPTEKLVKSGEKMADLNVTKVSKDGKMIWFEDVAEVYSDSAGVPHRHWPYQGQKLVTEDGKREFQANYPGDEVYLGVKDRKLTAKDFSDTDKDGRKRVFLSNIAPGDEFILPTAVSLYKHAQGTYRVKANCPFKLHVPATDFYLGRKVEGKFKMVKPELDGDGLLSVTEEDLKSGDLFIIIPDNKGGFTI